MRKLKLTELNRTGLAEYKIKDKFPIVVVLDNIRSAMNVGSFFRTADGFSLKKIFLCGISAQPPHKEINKTAIGADLSVEWTYVENVRDCITELKAKNYKIVGIEQTDKSIMLNDFLPSRNEKFALVFGNEIDGISDSILDLLDFAVEIPQFGTKHSFNVSVAGGIVIWDFVSKMMQSKML
jgi:tRNA G18 (ribose-2'-O)-methylase SpoU